MGVFYLSGRQMHVLPEEWDPSLLPHRREEVSVFSDSPPDNTAMERALTIPKLP